MMHFSDQILMAFADGELDEATRRAVEEAIREDEALAHRVAQYKARQGRRGDVLAAFGPAEGAPPRRKPPLRAVVSRGTVVQLDAVRASRAASQVAPAERARRWSWLEWAALGFTLVFGLLGGAFFSAQWHAEERGATQIGARDGNLLARGALAAALSQQLSGAAPSAQGGARIGLSFLSMDGQYCRSFGLGRPGQYLVGLACRSGQDWRLPLLVQDGRPGAVPTVPAPVREAVDQRINGQPLDGRAEQEAVRRGWQR
ncbi:MAG: hypothetical protein V4754_04645 [Pseudomonadota bacterium]